MADNEVAPASTSAQGQRRDAVTPVPFVDPGVPAVRRANDDTTAALLLLEPDPSLAAPLTLSPGGQPAEVPRVGVPGDADAGQADPDSPAMADTATDADQTASVISTDGSAPGVPTTLAVDEIAAQITQGPAAIVAQPTVSATPQTELESSNGIQLAAVQAEILSAAITPVPQGGGSASVLQIDDLLTHLKTTLDAIGTALSATALAESLPLLGTALKQIQQALATFTNLETAILAAIQPFAMTGGTDTQLQTALNTALAQQGFGANGVAVHLNGSTLNLTFNNSDSLQLPTISFDPHLGLPGLGFDAQGSVATTLSYDLALNASVDATGNAGANDGGSLTFGVGATATALTADATLGFLQFSGALKSSDPTFINGTFTLPTSGSVTFGGTANTDIHLQTDIGSGALPGLGADLDVNWTFNNGKSINPSDESQFGNQPTVALNNVTVDLGSFVTNFLKPTLDDLDALIAPLRPALDLFNTDITPLESLPDSIKQVFDTNHDGRITLADFLGKGGGSGEESALENIITTLTQIDQLTQYFDSANASGAQFAIGSFSLPADIRKPDLNISTVAPTPGPSDPSWSSYVTGLSGELGTELQSLESTGFSFPFLDNLSSLAGLFLGGTANLVQFNIPQANFGFGKVQPDGTVADPATDYQNLFTLPLWSPPPVTITLNAALSASFGLAVGFDTSGLSAYKNSNYTQPADILNGLYFANPTYQGVTVPMATFGGNVALDINLGAADFADVSGGGDVGGSINIGLGDGTSLDTGKVYLSQIANALNSGNASGLFTVNGEVSAGLDVSVDLLGQTVARFTSPRLVLWPTGSNGQGPMTPLTVWTGGASGDFETAGNWGPTFTLARPYSETGVTSPYIRQTDVYGDCKIGADSSVTFNGTLDADAYSLQLADGSALLVQSGNLLIDGQSTQQSNIAGTVEVSGDAKLTLGGIVNNTSVIYLGPAPGESTQGYPTPELGWVGPLALIGTGRIDMTAAGAAIGSDFSARVRGDSDLINEGNLIEGSGLISGVVENYAEILATGTGELTIAGTLHNFGLLAAEGSGPTQTRLFTRATLAVTNDGLEYTTLNNSSGTISAAGGGIVRLDSGDFSYSLDVIGGTLDNTQPAVPLLDFPTGTIEVGHVVTLTGGPSGMELTANIDVLANAALTLSGLIKGVDYRTSLGASGVTANGNTVDLANATIRGGLLDGRIPAGGPSGEFVVQNAATLDGGSAWVAVGGTLQVQQTGYAPANLTIDGDITPSLNGGAIDMNGGTITVGIGGQDGAALEAPLAGSVVGAKGTLLMDGTTAPLITGFDTATVIINDNWLIEGYGTLGNGRVSIDNLDTIEATGTDILHALVLNGGVNTDINFGVLLAAPNSYLYLNSSVNNSVSGQIIANGGVVAISGIAVTGGTLSTGGGGTIALGTGARLDGGTVGQTLAANALITLDTAPQISGDVINQTSLALKGSSLLGSAAVLTVVGNTTLSGAGTLTLADFLPAGAPNAATQVVTGVNPNGSSISPVLDNTDNTIAGIGYLGNGQVALINETAGSIFATGGTLFVDGGATGLINHGQVTAAAGATMVLASKVVDTGATLTADAGAIIFRAAIAGGAFATPDGGQIISDSGTLDGRANPLTIPVGVTVDVLATVPTATVNNTDLEGNITNQGQIFLQSNGALVKNRRSLLLSGTARLGGGGVVSMTDLSSVGAAAADAILGTTGTDTLDNVDNRIVGWGTIGGAGTSALTLINETAGTIDAADGEIFLNNYAAGNHSVNQGVIEAVGGTLDLSGTINNAGGTISSFNDGTGHSGIVLIDGFSIQGGLLTGDLTDRASLIALTTKNGTLDGTTIAVSIAAGGQVQAGHDTKLTLLGSIVDQGTIELIGQAGAAPVFGSGDADLVISGNVTLSGTGGVMLSHLTTPPTGTGQPGFQIISGHSPADTLNNAATIGGVGAIGIGGLVGGTPLTLNNLTPGVISASGGALTVSTGYRGGSGSGGAAPVTNTGLLTAGSGGLLDLQSDIMNAGGTIGATGGGFTLLDNDIVKGGSFAGGGQVLGTYATIDATASTVTLTQGANVGARSTSTAGGYGTILTLAGSFVNHGTIFVESPSTNPTSQAGNTTISFAGSIALSGGGQFLLVNDLTGGSVSDYLSGAYSVNGVSNVQDTLDNIDNTISGSGKLGNTQLFIRNEDAGIISSTGTGTLLLNTQSSNSIPTLGGVVNKGTLRALGGTLDLASVIDNRGGTIAALGGGIGHSGTVILDGSTIEGGLFSADPNDPGSYLAANSQQSTLDGTNGAVTLGTGNPLRIQTNSALTVMGTIQNLGTVTLNSTSQSGIKPTIEVMGTVDLSGGGMVTMSYSNNANDYITGQTGADLLNNVNNTIIGEGVLGFEDMSLLNESDGIIAAQGGQLNIYLGTGDSFTNQGLLEASGGLLYLHVYSGAGTIANAGGTIAARNDGHAHSGTVDLDGVRVLGGTLAGDPNDPASMIVASRPTTLDGSTNSIVITQAAVLSVGVDSSLTFVGTIADHGTIINNGAITDNASLTLDGTVANGSSATFTVAAMLQNSGGIVGDVTLGGGGALINMAGGTISGSGLATVRSRVVASVNNAGLIDPASYGVDFSGGGTVNNVAGGTIAGTIAGVAISGGPATITNAGTIIGGTGDAVMLAAGYANRLILSTGAAFAGVVDGGNKVSAAIASTLELSGAGTLSGLGSKLLDFGSIQFDPGAQWQIEGSVAALAGTITGFASADRIEIDGIVADGSRYAGGVLTLTHAGATVASLDLPDLGATPKFQVTNLNAAVEVQVACFMAGTRIRTTAGDVAVEDLRVGQMVHTLAGGGARPIIWMGHRTLDCTRHRDPQRAWPIRVRPGAFGHAMPHRDLWLSPDHAVFVKGVLIPIKHLLNAATIVQEPRDRVTYWHLELDRHDVIHAENLPTESYLDTGNRATFANGTVPAPYAAVERTAVDAWEVDACAPLVEDGPMLAAARQVLAARARSLGMSVQDMPVVEIGIEGQVSLIVPADADGFCLVSRSDRVGQDRRCLGALLREIRVNGQALSLSDARLAAGFHEVEHHDGQVVRWTNGRAAIALGRAAQERLVQIYVVAIIAGRRAG
jgi:hypothetical protein